MRIESLTDGWNGSDSSPRLSHRVGGLVDSFETVIYAIAFFLLVAAAILVAIFLVRSSTRRAQPNSTP